MKLKISELSPNPFKKFIRNGEMDKDRVEVLKESIEHGTLPEHFFARKFNNAFQLTSGHHRIEALNQAKGKDYQVDVTLVNFSDEQMLVDMVRENITQRDTDFHDTGESIILARSWLESKASNVKQFDNTMKKDKQGITHVKGTEGSIQTPDSYRSIAKFLSKNGKSICYETVRNYLDIYDTLDPKLIERIKRTTHAGIVGISDEDIGVKEALAVSRATDDKKEQEELIEALHRSDRGRAYELIPKYKSAPDEIKQKVLKGEIDIVDIESASLDQEIKDYNKDNPRSEFIPNFAGRLKQFDKDVYILEKQVKAFSMVFHDKRFKERYATLKPKQQDSLHGLIFDISKRVKKCYEEVEYFKNLLNIPVNKNIGLLEEKE